MQLKYDPADGIDFWNKISALPGYPSGETMPIRLMLFEAGALFKLGEALKEAGAQPDQPVFVVMDTTPMRRGEESLKPLALDVLRRAGWQVQTGGNPPR